MTEPGLINSQSVQDYMMFTGPQKGLFDCLHTEISVKTDNSVGVLAIPIYDSAVTQTPDYSPATFDLRSQDGSGNLCDRRNVNGVDYTTGIMCKYEPNVNNASESGVPSGILTVKSPFSIDARTVCATISLDMPQAERDSFDTNTCTHSLFLLEDQSVTPNMFYTQEFPVENGKVVMGSDEDIGQTSVKMDLFLKAVSEQAPIDPGYNQPIKTNGNPICGPSLILGGLVIVGAGLREWRKLKMFFTNLTSK